MVVQPSPTSTSGTFSSSQTETPSPLNTNSHPPSPHPGAHWTASWLWVGPLQGPPLRGITQQLLLCIWLIAQAVSSGPSWLGPLSL